MQTSLVTGAAGFIGFHVATRCLQAGMQVVGLDNLCEYYDVGLKISRLDQLRKHSNFEFVKMELNDRDAIANLRQGDRGSRFFFRDAIRT